MQGYSCMWDKIIIFPRVNPGEAAITFRVPPMFLLPHPPPPSTWFYVMKGKRTTIFFSATKCTLRYDSAIHIEVNACTCIQDEKPFGLFEKINPDEINVYDSTYNYSSHKKNDRTTIINEDENEHLYVASLRIISYRTIFNFERNWSYQIP